MIHFELFFAQEIKVRASVHLLPYRNSVGPAPFLEKAFLFPLFVTQVLTNRKWAVTGKYLNGL